ncbi:putative isochorismatase family protein [Colletotrichum gloeosporioides]|uniref:Putative isochorismatase family protein n=1 Tax=Colletotrichum gloeosporioides TaxID=474922 RepID=A0A8H4C545_COLGL|nr:putative isochorismatase family protein [Colletotrichum gloeosporioides]KAF3797595.1 putative isochorismatase family protein [Colletotrichum gloeosporioides]
MRHASETPTAVLLVDIQEGFKHPTHWGSSRSTPSFEANVASILRAARERNSAIASSQSSETPISIIHVHHHSRSPTSALHPSHFLEGSSTPSVSPLQFAAPLNNETILVKNFNSSFVGTQLESILRSGGIRQLVVLGLTTDHCVSTTVRMAANLQVLGDDGGPDGNGEGVHGVILVRDAVAAYEKGGFDAETVHAVSLASLDREFAEVVSAKDVTTKVIGDISVN